MRPPAAPPAHEIDAIVRRALDEDLGAASATIARDVTSWTCVPAGARAKARLVAKSQGRLAGLDVFARVFELCDPGAEVLRQARDGDAITPRQVLAEVRGLARGLLVAERTALNLVQRMSGIATLTARFVEASGGARVLDTRKTTPSLRVLEKYAVLCGGGENHRFGLFDQAMVKNNHVDLAGRPLREVVEALRRTLGPDFVITCEARDEAEALAGVEGGADVVLLDNMEVERMRALCPRLREAAAPRGRPLQIEASGGIDLETAASVAAAGVDRLSVGALTHSAPALDLSLYLEPLP